MTIEQIYTNCLAEAAYYIESDGEAAIVDPLRETEPYVEMASDRGAKIKYIFETHFHADFVSGHVDLARETGATIVFGPTAETGFEALIAADEQEFRVGKLTIRVLHTPGHTPESTTYLLLDESGKEHAIFSGDTLFIGDVGRPDLAVKSDLTEKDLAGMLYDSLRNRIMTLSDHVVVYPAHGAGSACGKNMSKETFDTLGHQKVVNYALQDISREEFIKEVTDGILPPPQYFPKAVMLNKQGYKNVIDVVNTGSVALDIEAFKKHVAEGALIVDVRSKDHFKAGFIPGSLFIGLDGSFAVWAGTLIKDLDQKIVLISDGREREAVTRLSRVGYDNCQGFLKGGFNTWTEAGGITDTIETLDPKKLMTTKESADNAVILDVRKPGEYESEHVDGARLFPLDFINGHPDDLDKEQTYLVHCKSGYRSVIAISILKRRGYTKLMDVTGGMLAIQETTAPIVENACAG